MIKILTLLLVCSILILALPAESRLQEVQKQNKENNELAKALENFKGLLNQDILKADELFKKVKNLNSTDIKRELADEVSGELRLAIGQTYLNLHNIERAIDNFYLASLKIPITNSSDEKLKLDKVLLDLWFEKNSEISTKYFLNNLLNQTTSKIDKKIFDIFITNSYLDDKDYKDLKRGIEREKKISDETNYLFSKVAIKFSDLKTALLHLQMVDDKKELSPQKHYTLGTLMVKLGKYDDAIGHFQKCLKSIPNEVQDLNLIRDAATIALARVYGIQHNWEDAVKNYSKIDSSSRFYPEVLLESGYVYYKMGKFRRSLEALDYLPVQSANINLFLDSMKIKGRELILGNYSETALKSYLDLILQLDYEKIKLESAEFSYSGSEDGILTLLNPHEIETSAKIIPSRLMIKVLSSTPSIQNLSIIKKELTSLDDELKKSRLLSNHLKSVLEAGEILPSLEKSYDWLNQREKETLSLITDISENLLDLLPALELEKPTFLKNFIEAVDKDRRNPQEVVCSDLQRKIALSFDNQKESAADIEQLKAKSKDLNELILSGWEIMNGDRERIALELKEQINSEYRIIEDLKEENSIYLSNLKTYFYNLNRICSLNSQKSLGDLISKSTKNFNNLIDYLDPKLKKALPSQDYSLVQKTNQLVSLLADIPKIIDKFVDRLRNEEKAILVRSTSELKDTEAESKSLMLKIEEVKKKFNTISKPIIKLALVKAVDLLDNYMQSYGWGLVSSYYDQKKETKEKLRELYLKREDELNRINNNFKLISNEN